MAFLARILLCIVGQPYGERSLHRKTCETISWLASVFHLAVTRFGAKEAKTVSEGLQLVKNNPPSFALIDLRLEDGNGLDVVKELNKSKKDSRIVMLTGYGNLPTAVAAVKAGAIDYMAKPVDADDVEAALLAAPESKAKPPENPMSADRVKWEHIHRVFELCNRNVSETARRLKMHRRTLQRILSKRSPR